MPELPWPALLRCTACHSEQLFQRDQMIEKLGDYKMLRRVVNPEPEVLAELWTASVNKFTCQDCGAQSLSTAVFAVEGAGWGEAKKCEGCNGNIPPERLEVFPNSTLCATCQSRDDRGEAPVDDVDYCPRCGNIMEVRQSNRGGTTGYRLYCSSCGR